MGIRHHDKGADQSVSQNNEQAKEVAPVAGEASPAPAGDASAVIPHDSQTRAQRREAQRLARETRQERQPRPAVEDEPKKTEERPSRTRTEEQPSKAVGSKSMSVFKAFRNNGASGRASQFVGQFNRYMKENPNDTDMVEFNKSNSLLILRDVQTEIVTFIAMLSIYDDKLYYNVIIAENKETVVQDKNRKSDRRDRRRGRVSDDVRVYQALPDMMNDAVLDKIHDYLFNNSGKHVREEDLIYTGYTILSYKAPLDSFDAIKPIIGAAYETNIEAANVLEPLDNEYFKESGIQLEGIISTSGSSAALGFDGRPIRNDIGISIETFCQTVERNPILSDKEGQQWATASAYLDLIPGRSLYNEGDHERRNSRTTINACLVPRIVFSEVDIYQNEIRGPLIRLLSPVATAIELSKSNRYLKPLMPRAFSNQKDRDIECIGFLMDPEGKVEPQRLALDNPNDDKEVFEFLERLIRHDKGMEIAYRHVQGQPGSSTATIFQDIYEGDKDAEDYLFDVLDDATDNKFSDEWDSLRGKDVIAAAIDVPDGYYLSHNGERPITDIDHVYAASQFKDTDTERLDDFIDCFATESSMDYDERMTKLVELMMHLTQDTFKFTNIATLYIFDPVFLSAVFNSFSKAKMALRVDKDRDEIRGRRGNRSGSNFGVQYDQVRGRGNDRTSGRDRGGRSSRRRSAW